MSETNVEHGTEFASQLEEIREMHDAPKGDRNATFFQAVELVVDNLMSSEDGTDAKRVLDTTVDTLAWRVNRGGFHDAEMFELLKVSITYIFDKLADIRFEQSTKTEPTSTTSRD